MTLREWLDYSVVADGWLYWAIGGTLFLIGMSLTLMWVIRELKSGCSDEAPFVIGTLVSSLCCVCWPLGGAFLFIFVMLFVWGKIFAYLKRRYYP